MEGKSLFVLIFITTTALAFPAQDTKLVPDSKPGQEFVFVQSSGSGARPIERKDKTEEKKLFETAHKIPPGLTFALNDDDDEDVPEKAPVKPVKSTGKKVHKRQAAESPAPAPPGAIKLNVAQLLEKYKQVMKTTTQAPTSTSAASSTKPGKRRGSKKRSKRSPAGGGPTSPNPILTTAKIAPKNVDTDVVGSASEKQRSRIQIKKGPNGQEYEYEYVYYYYDDDEDSKDKVTNSHDGPAKNSISRSDKSREKPTPEANEVVPSRSKSRGRQLGEEDNVQEDRLPANTRFPPRSRNLNTTPLPEDEPKPTPSRSRGRGRPAAETPAIPEDDNVSDETQGTRGRTRANVRRPSLELVDSETFNTHSAAAPAGQSPTFPAQLPAGPEEPADKPETRKGPAPVAEQAEETSKPNEDAESTTVVSGMNKIALDLYAISQGTQKLFGEEGSELSTEENGTDGTTLDSSSTEEIETTTPTTTTTTTTTTTPAPTTTTTTTTTTTEAPTKAGRFGGRRTPLSGRKSSTTTTTETSAPTESKPKKFGRPGFGGRARSKPTPAPTAAVEEEAHKEESKPTSQAKPSRSRFGGSRPRGRTTTAPSEDNKEEASTSAPSTASHRPSLPRARPAFNSLRGRGRSTTAAPSSEEASSDSEAASSSEASSTTSRPGRRIAGGNANIKSLRPGPRINLAGRRGALSTTTTTEASNAQEEDHHITGDEEETHAEAASEKEEAPAAAPVDNSPLGRLRNKNRLNIQPKAKSASAASASAPVQVRRVNPLLNRRRPGQTTEAPSSEAPSSSEATESEAEEPAAETEAAPSSTTTTEEPKGLNKLLAGRRRLATRTPGTINHK